MRTENFETWIDLEKSETERTYIFPGCEYKIVQPSLLFVKKSGSHKIVSKDGICHYINKGWVAIKIEGTFDINVE